MIHNPGREYVSVRSPRATLSFNRTPPSPETVGIRGDLDSLFVTTDALASKETKKYKEIDRIVGVLSASR